MGRFLLLFFYQAELTVDISEPIQVERQELDKGSMRPQPEIYQTPPYKHLHLTHQ